MSISEQKYFTKKKVVFLEPFEMFCLVFNKLVWHREEKKEESEPSFKHVFKSKLNWSCWRCRFGENPNTEAMASFLKI